MTEDPELARRLRILEAKLRRSEANRVKLEEQRDFDEALHRRVIRQMLEAEIALRESEQRAQQASSAKSEFLANMSHEIRTPLTGIIGLAELLVSTDLEPRQRRMVENLTVAASLLARLIDDVLDFSRIEAGKLQLDEQDFDPGDTMKEAADLVAERAARAGLRLTCVLPPPIRWYGDAFRFRQVLINLLGNALKFTHEGEVELRGDVVPGQGEHPDLAVTVADTGIGIRPAQLQEIFEPFRQADGSTTRRYGGTGLGLSISREIMRAVGGTLRAAPRDGGGSVFTVVLPGVRRVERRIATAPVRTVGGTIEAVRGCRILVAEDNEVNGEVVASLLSASGATVTLVSDGAQAIEALGRAPFDLVLVDLHMPHKDGIEVARYARGAEEGERATSRNRGTPILALTAAILRADRARCDSAGIDDMVPKPFTRASVATAMERWCRPRIATAIDRSVFDETAALVGEDRISMIVEKFSRRALETADAIVDAARCRDASRAAELAHLAKAAAGQLGASALARRLDALEASARRGVAPDHGEAEEVRQAACDAIEALASISHMETQAGAYGYFASQTAGGR